MQMQKMTVLVVLMAHHVCSKTGAPFVTKRHSRDTAAPPPKLRMRSRACLSLSCAYASQPAMPASYASLLP